MMKRIVCAALAIMLSPWVARAELRESAADGFLVEHRYQIGATPEAAWAVLVHPERYWPADHTWSGAAENLSLRAEAGGCFCERWDAASVEHGRVVMARPGALLRIRGALGPLQEMAVSGVLTITLEPTEGGTEAVVTYRVSGDSLHELAAIAPSVDKVIGIQFDGFARLAGQPQGE